MQCLQVSRFSILVAILALSWMVFPSMTYGEEQQEQPNILFLFADDLDPGALQAGAAQTPHIDSIAAAGYRFNNAYNMGGWHGAVCVASRAMLMTGAYLWQAQELEKNLEEVVAKRALWPQHMAHAGYETYFTGKWHLPADPGQVFHHVRHVRGGMPGTVESAYNRPPAEGEDPWKPWDESIGGFWEGGKHWSEVVADDGLAFLEDAVKRDKPFFMMLSFNAPHDPRQAPRAYVEQYPPDDIPVPPNFLAQYPYLMDIGAGPILRDERLAPFPRTKASVQLHMSEYYAIIAHMDAQIGRVLQHLKASGFYENTLIVFSADHGLACGQHGFMGKQNMYEHSMRAPLILSGPGIPEAGASDARVYYQDLVPTLLELVSVPAWEGMAYQSLVPFWQGESTERAAVYGAYMNFQRMLIVDNFKVIHYPRVDVWRLYDLTKDPWEINDLAGHTDYGEKLEALQREMRQHQIALGDPIQG